MSPGPVRVGMDAGSRCGRRRYLGGLALAGVATLAGCLGDDGRLPDPIALNMGQVCDQCGMVIENHPGPAGQTYFEEGPDDRDGPAWFCSGVCTSTYTLDREDEGWSTIVVYLTDYAAVDYEFSTEDGRPFISAHLEAKAFADARELTLVVGSDVRSSMGPDLVPFGERDAAEAFAADHGGHLVAHDDVDRDLLAGMMA